MMAASQTETSTPAAAGTSLFGEGITSARASMYNVLRSLARNNVDHFLSDTSYFAKRFHAAFVKLEGNLNEIEPQVERIRSIAHYFDLDPKTPGNGYRSFIAVVDSCVLQCIRLCRHICLKRSSFLFRSNHYCLEVEAYAATLCSLKVGLLHLNTLYSWSKRGNLYPDESHSPEELLMEAETMDQYCFYGRCLGFQFCESMRKPLLALSLLMASFSEVYYNTGGMLSRTASSLLNCGRYVLNPEERAQRIVDISQRASVDFCKAFWLLQETEIMQQLPSIVCPQVVVNKVFAIAPDPMELPQYEGDDMVEIPLPTSHIGVSALSARLLSAVHRKGQLDEQAEKQVHIPTLPPATELVIHCHGGGFVAQSSKSHEVYLRDWARQLNIPIFCIDYSLAPLAPFPRALEECFYLYAWALRNAHLLGTTADKIILVGDSAGGNLILGIAMRAIETGIRKPDGIMAMYTPLLIEFIPSPSRLLCLMDPLLPFGFMMRCLKAYAGQPPSEKDKEVSSNLENHSVSPKLPTFTISDTSEDPEKIEHSNLEKSEGTSVVPPKSPDHVNVSVTPLATTPSDISVNSEVIVDLSAAPISKSVPLEGTDVSELTDAATKILNQYKQDKFSRSDTMTTVSLTSDEESPTSPTKEIKNLTDGAVQKDSDYVAEFIEKYGLVTDEVLNAPILEEENTDNEENVIFERTMDLSLGLGTKLSNVTSRVMSGITNFLTSPSSSSNVRSPGSEKGGEAKSFSKQSPNSSSPTMDPPQSMRSLADEFKKFRVNKDPYLSPYLASDEVLKELPPITLLALQLDPTLDDSIMFCKRLRSLGKKANITILDKLPHGFLNFSLISRDAHDGSKVCVEELRKLLALEDEIDIEMTNALK